MSIALSSVSRLHSYYAILKFRHISVVGMSKSIPNFNGQDILREEYRSLLGRFWDSQTLCKDCCIFKLSLCPLELLFWQGLNCLKPKG